MELIAFSNPRKRAWIEKTLLVMKLTSFLLLAICLNVSAKGVAQTVSFSKQNISLEKVFSIIKKQTGYTFVYRKVLINNAKKVSLHFKNASIEEVLDNCFKDQQLTYSIVNKIVIIQQKETPVVTSKLNVSPPPPPIAIQGKVISEEGKPLAGASVAEKGTRNASTTTEDGSYGIRVTGTGSTLVFTYVGYSTEERVVGASPVINVSLKLVSSAMQDVVVVGYGTQKKISSTGAIATMTTKELVQSPVANISNSLVGRLPGLFAQQLGGEPGNDGSKIRIRGVGTFSGNTDPLTLVDGIEVSNYNNIDPNEIESVTVLKDASSTAVYGIRGANGVLIITTKRGKIGPPKVSYTFNQGFNSFIGLRRGMNSGDYATNYNAGLKADSYTTGVPYTPRYSATDIDLYRNGKDPIFHPDSDWGELLFKKTSAQMQHNLSVSGGQRRVKYFISGGYFQQEGLFKDVNDVIKTDFNPQSVYKRYNLRSNFNFEATSRLKIALDLSTQIEARSGNNHSSTERLVRDILYAAPLDGPGVVDGKIVNISANNQNPYISLLYPNSAGGVRRSYRNYLNGSLRLDYDLGFITKGLSTHTTAAIQTYNDQTIINQKQLIVYMAYPINGGPINGGTVNYVPNTTETSFSFSQNGTYNRRLTAEAAIDYARRFGNHSFTGLLLYNQQKTFDPSFTFRVPKAYQSFVGRVTYDYDNRYLVEFNAGYNGTENFAPGKRFGFFPAYSIGWVASNEDFFPKKSIVTFLKFRGSYGEVGNDQIGGNRFLYNPTSYTGYSAIYYFGNIGTNYSPVLGLREGATGNPDVTWERSIKKNLGMEMRLIRDKVRISADVFSENRDNILAIPQTISALTGLTQPATNLGSMQNKGYEGDISFSDKIGQVAYRIGANYSFARNKVLFRDEIPNRYTYQNRTGHRLNQNFVLICDGIFNTWEEVNDAKRPVYEANQNRVQPGDLKFRDVNGDGVVNSFDAVPVGYSNVPEKTFGLSLSANYKGFDLSVLFQGVGNVSYYYLNNQRSPGFGNAVPAAAADYFNESWTQERYDAGLPISFPRFAVSSNPNQQSSSFFLADASYVRLKNAEAGYTARPDFLRKVGISSLRIYANANNLVTWKKTYKGIDPESDASNRSDTNLEPYPLIRTINVGLNANF